MQDFSISEFETFLTRYLNLNYPLLPDKEVVVAQRCEAARCTFDEVLTRYHDIDIAYESAMDTLLFDYHFSKYDFIDAIFRDNFEQIRGKRRERLIRRYILDLDPIFSSYPLADSNMELKQVVYEHIANDLCAGNLKNMLSLFTNP